MSRRCNNPELSLLGAECEGNNIEYAICNSDDCDGDSAMFTSVLSDCFFVPIYCYLIWFQFSI